MTDYEITIKPIKQESNDIPLIATGKIDLIDDFKHDFSSKVTTSPIEDGRSITDNVIRKPAKITISITVAMTRSGSSDLSQEAIASVLKTAGIEHPFSEKLFDLGLITDRPEAMLKQLVGWKDSLNIVSVDSLLYSYENMVIEKITANEKLSTGRSLCVMVTLREIFIVKTDTSLGAEYDVDLSKMTRYETFQQAAEAAKAANDVLEAERLEKEKQARAIAKLRKAGKLEPKKTYTNDPLGRIPVRYGRGL